MFVNKGNINTPRLPMLHHEESPEKPQYSTPLPPPLGNMCIVIVDQVVRP